ncbi:hypothetical protein JVU11DRAFT_8627 [Chiua virens]|nr:hypothetical protein JVU11DRAFT_8627 [Chiua virens]
MVGCSSMLLLVGRRASLGACIHWSEWSRAGTLGPARWADVDQGKFSSSSKVSCAMPYAQDGDTVILSGLRFERGMQTPVVM